MPRPPQRGREEAELITLDDDDDGPAFVNANPVITQNPVTADPTEEELGELILSWYLESEVAREELVGELEILLFCLYQFILPKQYFQSKI